MSRWTLAAAILVAGVGLAAPTQAQGQFLDASLTLVRPIPYASIQEVNERQTTDELLGLGCGSNHLVGLPSGHGFRFSEGDNENGCAAAHFPMQVPEGAQSLRVAFFADRHVVQPATAELPIEMLQEFHVHASAYEEPYQIHTVFTRQTASHLERIPFEFDVDIGGRSQIVLAWYFEDRGPTMAQQVPNPAMNQRFRATVSQPTYAVGGIPAAADVTQRTEDVEGNQAIQRLHVLAVVPDWAVAEGSASLQLRTSVGLRPARVEAPDGTVVPPEVLEVVEALGVLVLVVPADVVAGHGPGSYRVTYRSEGTLSTAGTMVPVALLLLAAPAVLGAAAFREAGRFPRQGGILGQEARQAFLTTAGALTALYGAIVAWVLLAGRWALLAAWPLRPEAAFLFLLLVLVTIGLLASILYWRQRLVRGLEADRRERERVTQELARSNKDLEMFAYFASHDLQEPLRKIVNFSELVDRRYGTNLPKEGREFLGIASGAARRMQELVGDLLSYARVGRSNLNLQKVDCNTLVDEVFRRVDAPPGAKLTRTRLPTVAADRVMLGALLQNLVGNAVKYRHPRRQPRVRVTVQRMGDAWRFAVEDNGMGFDVSNVERMFGLFQRLQGAEQYEGTGIGLAICKKIVDLHGGNIGAASTPGKGSVFHFTIPGRPPPSDGTASSRAADTGEAPPSDAASSPAMTPSPVREGTGAPS